MKFGDKVMLKSKEECYTIDGTAGSDRLGFQDGMIFGKEVTVLIKDTISFKIKEAIGHYSYLWVEKHKIEEVEEVSDTIVFKLDDNYCQHTKMYLKATKLAIDVMERIHTENPEFWELLKASGARPNFFREILEEDDGYWNTPEFDWADADFKSFFEWDKSRMGSDYWTSMDRLTVKKNKASTYHFIDDEINLEQICSDAIKDGKTTFMVEGGEEIYVGWLKGYNLKNEPNVVLEILDDYPLTICTIPKEGKAEWIKTLQKYATEYSTKNEDRDEYIKDRGRAKESNRFNVTSW